MRTKLQRPRVSGDLIARPHLLEHLDRGLGRKLTLISAPAGYGKTTLLLQWLDTIEARLAPVENQEGTTQTQAAWLSLDQSDGDLGMFLRYLVAAVRSAYPGACAVTEDLTETSQQAPRDYVVATLANELAELPGGLILALDDFHTIEGRQVPEFLSALLGYLPQHVQPAILTRQDPDLPLARLRALGQMVELRASDLEFTPEEARAFLRRASAGTLSDKAMGLLEEYTEGWIAGLRLTALALRNAADPEAYVEGFRGAELRYTMDYLANDVLSHQPPIVREFLLQTSVLDRLSGPLCDAVVAFGAAYPSGQEIISLLEDANLFIVPLDNEDHWHRYHQLFREMLRRQLEQSYGEGEIQALHRRASAWFEDRGSVEEAIRHAVAAQEPVGAAQIVERQVREALDHGDWFSLGHWP
jgi:LuxR family maltose regulon positive regulatory protein